MSDKLNGNIVIKDLFICHLVYEHDFIQQLNDMIVESCDLQEHLFVVYANHAWEESKKYNLKNSYYINSFDDTTFMEYTEKSAQIIVHCLYTPAVTNYLFSNRNLLKKVNWKLWGGDLYLYRQVGSVSNSEENELKRKIIIKDIAFITTPIEEEYKHALEVYGGNAQFQFASYLQPRDFSDFRITKNISKKSTINILVGNSGYLSSNHIAAFSYLEKFHDEDIKIYCPLSYGDKEYTKEVCKIGVQFFGDKFVPLLDFIQFDEYVTFLSTIDIAVMNHNRQQGVGNIVTLLFLGKKVYMQPEITTYKCLHRLGVSIYDIHKIERDNFDDFKEFANKISESNSEIVNAHFSNKSRIKAWQTVFSNALNQNQEIKRKETRPVQRVLFVNHNLYPFENSGTPISTLNHAVGMKERGKDVAVLIPSHEIKNGFEKQLTDKFVLYKIPRLDKYKVFFGDIENDVMSEYLDSFEKIVDEFAPDVVHINDYVFMPEKFISLLYDKGILVVRNVCNLEEICHMDCPVISNGLQGKLCSGPETSRNCAECYFLNKLGQKKEEISSDELNILSNKIQNRFASIKALYNQNVDGIIFTEKSFEDYFTKFINIREDIIKVIPRGFNFSREKVRDSKKIISNKIRFAYIGHIMFAKGIDIVLRAVEQIAHEYDFMLDIYGGVVDHEYLGWINKLEMQFPSKIKYHGQFEKDDINKIADSIDIAIIPSYFDTYNRVVREFLYQGIPIIATKFFGSSIIKDGVNGIKINVGDDEELVSAIKRLMENPNLINELSNGAISTGIPSLIDEVAEIAKFYNELAEKKSARQVLAKKENYKINKSLMRLIAFYLPQYHPIPENNKAWGKGFTEWTNVVKAKPLFHNHYQPHLPSELGYYDLRLDEVRKEQIDLAKEHGLYGFCYYYYWFNGKQVLETPIKKLLANKNLDFPFCICWANENWTKKWDGLSGDIFLNQDHNTQDDINFIKSLFPYFKDERYIRIDNKPMLLIYRTELFPDILTTSQTWRNEINRAGLGEIYLVRVEGFTKIDPKNIGFDAAVEFAPDWSKQGELKDLNEISPEELKELRVFDYRVLMQNMIDKNIGDYKLFRGVTPSWDNTARRGSNASVFINSSPELYREWLTKIITESNYRLAENERFVFINAWNEWAEGNHLEPDLKNGRQYLEATLTALKEAEKEKSIIEMETQARLLSKAKENDELIDRLNSEIAEAVVDNRLFEAAELIKKVALLDEKNIHNPKNIILLNNKRKEIQIQIRWNKKLSTRNLIKAEKLIQENKLDEAEKLLVQLIGFEPEHVEALIDLSVVKVFQKDYAAAKRLLDDVFLISPNHETAKENYEYIAQFIPPTEGAELKIISFNSFKVYTDYCSRYYKELTDREIHENGLLKGEEEFFVNGFCYLCRQYVDFKVDYNFSYISNNQRVLNWRERLVCPSCGMNNRLRAAIHLIKETIKPLPQSSIYISEQCTSLYNRLADGYMNLTGSEYLGNNISLGSKNENGVRNEDFTKLTFNDETFDLVLCFEVFDHIVNYKKALSESFRVLKDTGMILFSVPFNKYSEKNLVRAKVDDTSEIVHILPPKYHGDPLSNEGGLSFYQFGWEILNDLRTAGFINTNAIFVWSKEYGYYGGDQIFFVAKKSLKETAPTTNKDIPNQKSNIDKSGYVDEADKKENQESMQENR